MSNRKPAILVFAGPNGSGKSSVTEFIDIIPPYINADDIKREHNCSDLEAAQMADSLREHYVALRQSFTFETVLSTDAKIQFLKKAKDSGYFIKGFFVLTADPDINVLRVKERVANGGHDVPEDKIISRYVKSLLHLPEFVRLCDVCHIYDNSESEPYRIFKKSNSGAYYCWETAIWDVGMIERLIDVEATIINN